MSISSQVVILFFSKFRLKSRGGFKGNFARRVIWFVYSVIEIISFIITLKRLMFNISIFSPIFLHRFFVKYKLASSVLLRASMRLLRVIRIRIKFTNRFVLERILIFAFYVFVIWTTSLFIIFWVLVSILAEIFNRRVWSLIIISFLPNIIGGLIFIFLFRNKSWRVVFVVFIWLNLIFLFKVFVWFFNLRVFFIIFIKLQDILTFWALLILIWMFIYILEVKDIRILMWIVFFIKKFFHLSGSILLKSLFFFFRNVATKRVLTVENRLVLIGMIITQIVSLFTNKLPISKRLSISIKLFLCVLMVLVIVSKRIFSVWYSWLFRYVYHLFVFVLFDLTLLKFD